jgi:hypothetical protein
MAVNRIRRPSAPAASQPASMTIPQGFVICPPQMVVASAWQLEIYRLAIERARAEIQVPRHHRRLFCCWN